MTIRAICPECREVRDTQVVYGRLLFVVHSDGKRGRWAGECEGSNYLVEDDEIIPAKQVHPPRHPAVPGFTPDQDPGTGLLIAFAEHVRSKDREAPGPP